MKQISFAHCVLLTFLFVLSSFTLVNAQTTLDPYVGYTNNYCKIEKIEITSYETIVTLYVPKKHYKNAMINSATVLVPAGAWDLADMRRSNLDLTDFPGFSDNAYLNQMVSNKLKEIRESRADLRDRGWLIRNLGNDKLDQSYKPKKGSEGFYFKLHFDKIAPGVEVIHIREIANKGWEWSNIRINNPMPSDLRCELSESQIKELISKDNDRYCGIYEGSKSNTSPGYKLACIKQNNQYILVFLSSNERTPLWKSGDIKAKLQTSATPGFFKAEWYMGDKTKNNDCFVVFDGGSMKSIISIDGRQSEDFYIKMYPNSEISGNSHGSEEWSGTGFALENGYVVTNHHVVDGANSIVVLGVNGNSTIEYRATVVGVDKNNDLALLKINDSRFTNFTNVPYAIKKSNSEVGTDVFVLGYPLTTYMGDEIKLTNGIISSKSGYQGDISTYQISAPLQPGNSGGPLFDDDGYVVGIINAGIPGADNVGYAIKTSYLYNLVDNVASLSIIPQTNAVKPGNLASKVSQVKNCVFFIKCKAN